jgi:rod shape-determining protein MreD
VIIEKTAGQKFDIAVRQTLPFLSALTVVLFTVTQTHLPLVNLVMPSLTLSIVYFWSIHRPELFGVGSAFVIGLLQDLLTGVPLGLFTMTMLLTRAGVATQGMFFRDKPFVVHWWGYALVAVLASAFTWVVAAMIQGVFAPPGQVFMALILNVLIFPLIFGLCNVVERRVLMDVL